MSDLKTYNAKSGTFIPVWTLEIQTIADDTDRILDAIMDAAMRMGVAK